MRYATARFNQHQRDLAYRIYVTDCLRIQVECVTATGGNPIHPNRFYDILNPKPVDNRTADEIIDGIRKKL